MEVLSSPTIPDAAKLKLTWAALTMPTDLVTWISHHDFKITDDGIAVYNLRFGSADRKPRPTEVADAVICLPGPTSSGSH